MSSSAPYSEVEAIRFTVAGDANNERDSVVEVKSYELFSGTQPVSNGAFDPRMGTTDHHYTCVTCGHQRKEDPGHPGRLRSRVALVSPLYVAEIRRWLRVVCLRCGAPVIDLGHYRKYPRRSRLAEAGTAATEGVRCPRCKAVHPKIVKTADDYFTYNAEYPPPAGDTKPRLVTLSPDDIRATFQRVADATVAALGRPPESHPKNLVLETLLVPPNTIRPGVRMGIVGSSASRPPTSNHDLTNVVQYLVRRELSLPTTAPEPVTREFVRQVQNTQQIYYNMIVGTSAAAGAGAPGGAGGRRGLVVGTRDVGSIGRGFPRKEGRLRRNLLGKRAWNVSRSTISGNPLLRPDEVGFPVAFARILQIEEVVQEFNRARLMTFFLNGRRRYPGCSRVIKRGTGNVHRVEGLRDDFQLELGDVLVRDIVTGDFALYNRAPSLERSSIGGHRIVVLEDPAIHTFQMNVTACDWYGADFDGDEMNLWIPRAQMAQVEARRVSTVANWFISTKSSGPVNGEVQDSVVGSFALSRSGVAMDKFHAMTLCAALAPEDRPPIFAGRGADARYSGREIISGLFSSTPVNYRREPRWYSVVLEPYLHYDPTETFTEMKQGQLLSGVLDKGSVGAGAGGGIFHLISREYGARKALEMVFVLQQAAIEFVSNRGFTVGTGDMVVTREALAEIHQIVEGLRCEAELNTARLLRGELVPPIGMTVHEYYEDLQKEALKLPDSLLRPILTSISPNTNGLFQMIATGSKGSTPNLLHIMGCIGQIEINTKRIQEQFGFRRTAVYFPRYATDPAAYGFVANSYMSGMSNDETVFNAMNGRFDLINKALSTASTGYINRKAIFALQSNFVDNYRSVSKNVRIVQLLYGEDGLDARQVERVPFRTVMCSDAEIRERFGVDPTSTKLSKSTSTEIDKALARLIRDRDWYRERFLRFEDTRFGHPMDIRRQMPVNVGQLVRNVQIAAETAAEAAAETAAEERPGRGPALAQMIGRVEEFCEALPYLLVNEIQERRRAPLPPYLAAGVGLLQMLVRAELAPRTLATLTPERLELVLDEVRLHFSLALVDYGTAAGVIAAQAVSEPLTQYMLDSHHRSVSGGTNKSGIVRPNEIFRAKPVEAEQSPEMLIRVLPEYEEDRAEVLQIANQIELMTFGRFVVRWDLLFESFGPPVYPRFADDAGWIAEFAEAHPLLTPPADLTSWCVRLELDRETLILKSMSLETIVERLRARTSPGLYVVHTPENAPRVFLRVYLRGRVAGRGATDEERVRTFIEDDLLRAKIRGVPHIRVATVVEVQRHRVDEKTGGIELRKVYAIKTVGTNLRGILTNRRIDPRRLVSSSVGDTFRTFGIAAARQTIVREIARFIGSSVPNIRHLLIYADEMTMTGSVTSLEIGGVTQRSRDNVLLRMAMHAPVDSLREAALEGAEGSLYGIAPYLMLGRTPVMGTTWNQFVMDEEFVRKNRKSIDNILDEL